MPRRPRQKKPWGPGDRAGFLRIYGIDAERWARRHGLEPDGAPCYYCGAMLITTIPFVTMVGRLRGLLSPPCACGNENTPYLIGFASVEQLFPTR